MGEMKTRKQLKDAKKREDRAAADMASCRLFKPDMQTELEIHVFPRVPCSVEEPLDAVRGDGDHLVQIVRGHVVVAELTGEEADDVLRTMDSVDTSHLEMSVSEVGDAGSDGSPGELTLTIRQEAA